MKPNKAEAFKELKQMISHDMALMAHNGEKIMFPQLAAKYNVTPKFIREIYNEKFKSTKGFTKYELLNLHIFTEAENRDTGKINWKAILKLFPNKSKTQVMRCYENFIKGSAIKSHPKPDE